MKTQKKNKIIAIILCIVIICGILLKFVFANDIEDVDPTVSGGDITISDGNATVSGGDIEEPTVVDNENIAAIDTYLNLSAYMVINESGSHVISGVNTDKPIVIEGGVVDLTIENVNITSSSAPAIIVYAPATLNLTVLGTNTLQGAPGYAGIFVEPSYDNEWNVIYPDSAKLNISGSGTLTAIGGNGDPTNNNLYGGGAGIGGNGQYDEYDAGRDDNAVDFGIVTITKNFTGTLNVSGGSGSGKTSGMFGGGAGIGTGGFNMSDDWYWDVVWGEINIHSGNINAHPTASNDGMGAGIGSGSGYGDSTAISNLIINISGGNINATGGYLSAGIGGGGICDAGTINISGGIITANGGQIDASLGAAGIGGGNDAAFTAINITGGNITATGSGGSAGIGGGTETQYSNTFYGDKDGVLTPELSGKILISGPNTIVTAYGGTGYGLTATYAGAGIGSGYVTVATKRSVAMNIEIKYGATVTAYAGYHAEAIGYGYNSKSLKNVPGDNVSYTGYGITLELDDSITLWAVNDDYYKPALVAANEYNGAPVKYGDIRYISDDVYLTTYSDGLNTDKTGDALSGIAVGQLKTDNNAPKGVNITWAFRDSEKIMDMDIDVVTNVPEEPLDTPFDTLHGNWATLYPAPIRVSYEWVGNLRPTDVAPPTIEFMVKGTQYTAKLQDPTGADYIFDGWYLDPLCENKFVDGTAIMTHTILYGRWIEGKPEVGTGNLKISKTVVGNDGDKERDFNFTISLSDTSISGKYGDVTFDNGQSTFTLRDEQSIEIKGVPVNVEYEIIEEEANEDGYITTSTNAKGYVMKDTLTIVSFENKKGNLPEETGWLSITKEVAGSGADKTLEFKFNVTLNDESINGTYGQMEFKNGVAEFYLKHGDRITASKLPIGVHFTVSEEKTGNYITTSSGESGEIVKDGSTATFINIYGSDTDLNGTGTLTITKEVKGTWGELDKEFTINIELSDKNINETFDDITFVNGSAKFVLKSGEAKIATGLPAGITYKITEDEANKNYYKTTYLDCEGVIVKDKTIDAKIVNYRDKTGNLSISKIVTGVGSDKNKKFKFIITLSGTYVDENDEVQNASMLNGFYNGVEFVDGIANLFLRHGETCTITGLPATLSYKVEEKNAQYYTITSSNETGIILADSTVETKVLFTNNRDAGTLVISKTVSGNSADTNKSFSFKISLDDTSINGTYGDIQFVNGIASFTLKPGNSIKAANLPEGIKYNVIETDYNGYAVTINGKETDSVNGTIIANKTIEEKFNNHKDIIPKDNPSVTSVPSDGVNTGDSNEIILYIIIGILAMICIVLLVALWDKKQEA